MPVVSIATDRIRALGWRNRFSSREALRVSMISMLEDAAAPGRALVIDRPMRRAVFLDRDGVLNGAEVRDGRPYPPDRGR